MHLNTISPGLKKIIDQVFASNYFSEFRLCGGTGLSLQTGHRISVDADFVTENPIENDLVTSQILKTFKNATDIHRGELGVFFRIDSIKVDFLSWNLPFIRHAVLDNGWRLLHKEEIIAMKLFAILQRGEKKDYMDIASLLKDYSLSQMLSFYRERHKASDDAVVLRFLASYSDIEFQPLPEMLNGLSWEEAKSALARAIKQHLK